MIFIVRLKGRIGFILPSGKKINLNELNCGKYFGSLKLEDLGIKIAVREVNGEKIFIAYNSEIMNNNSLHIALKYMKRMKCEEMHRELKNRLELSELNKR
ncbi:MAG: hypothetical protein N2312_04925 [Dictyoglomaceae bacterium]|nr:hypothetical protein [Dictyoglomaceae bacterium]